LKANGSLEQLHLGSNNLGSEGADKLLVGLQGNKALRMLDLSNNRVDDRNMFNKYSVLGAGGGKLETRGLPPPGRAEKKKAARDRLHRIRESLQMSSTFFTQVSGEGKGERGREG
jgi:hypothetical protein